MRPTLIATRGISGCGKSHWARQEAERLRAGGLDVAVSERDAWRDAVGVNRYGDVAGEARVTVRQDAQILEALRAGAVVIETSTNLRAEHLARLRRLAELAGAGFELVDFSGVPFEVCVERNRRRPQRVPGRCMGAQVPPDGLLRQHQQLQKGLAAEAGQRGAQARAGRGRRLSGWRRFSSICSRISAGS
jgi:predicted kinase